MGETVQQLQKSFEEAALVVERLLRPHNAALFRARAACYDSDVNKFSALDVQACLEKADAASPVEKASSVFTEGAQTVMGAWESCHDGVAKKMRDKFAPFATPEGDLPPAKQAELEKDYPRALEPCVSAALAANSKLASSVKDVLEGKPASSKKGWFN